MKLYCGAETVKTGLLLNNINCKGEEQLHHDLAFLSVADTSESADI